MRLANLIENTFGRCCSSSDALFPSSFAFSKSFFACSRSLILATMMSSPICMRMA
jgi:hypothetical protein